MKMNSAPGLVDLETRPSFQAGRGVSVAEWIVETKKFAGMSGPQKQHRRGTTRARKRELSSCAALRRATPFGRDGEIASVPGDALAFIAANPIEIRFHFGFGRSSIGVTVDEARDGIDPI